MSGLSLQVGRAFFGAFKDLRPAQRAAVEPVLRGDDVLISSGTGSGKTEAALAPLLDRHLAACRDATGVTVLYVTPTRALANDLLRRLERPVEELGLRVGIRHGERNDLKRVQRPDVLITTPESLDVMLVRAEPALQDVQAVVLDEVHLVYNTQRGFQLAVLLHRLEASLGRRLQICALSATIGHAEDVWAFLRPGGEVEVVTDTTARAIDAVIRVEAPGDRLQDILRRIMGQDPRSKVLLFVDAKRVAETVIAEVSAGTLRAEVLLHHASLDKEVRLEVERRFLEAPRAVCVATSTLELGIDIGDIDLVVLYGRAPGWQSFLQRIGRSNRRSSSTNVVCLVPASDQSPELAVVEYLAVLDLVLGDGVDVEAPVRIYGAALQQLASVVLSSRGAYVRRRELSETFRSFEHLDDEAVAALIDAGIDAGLFVQHPARASVGAGPSLHEFEDRWQVWGNYPQRSQQLELLVRGRSIGRVPATNLPKLLPGAVVRFSGGRFEIRQVHRDGVELAPTQAAVTAELTFGRGHRRADPTTLEQMVRHLEGDLAWGTLLNRRTEASVASAIADLRRSGFRADVILAEPQADGSLRYLTFAGEVMNKAIAAWSGVGTVGAVSDTCLQVDGRVVYSRLPADHAELLPFLDVAMPADEDLTVFQQLLPAAHRAAEFRELWLRSQSVPRCLARLRVSRVRSVPGGSLDRWASSRA
jgi:ATP-dependent helicase Lhr and Lhr-like helicase